MDPKDVGVVVNIVGSILINLGNNLQSSGHRTSNSKDRNGDFDPVSHESPFHKVGVGRDYHDDDDGSSLLSSPSNARKGGGASSELDLVLSELRSSNRSPRSPSRYGGSSGFGSSTADDSGQAADVLLTSLLDGTSSPGGLGNEGVLMVELDGDKEDSEGVRYLRSLDDGGHVSPVGNGTSPKQFDQSNDDAEQQQHPRFHSHPHPHYRPASPDEASCSSLSSPSAAPTSPGETTGAASGSLSPPKPTGMGKAEAAAWAVRERAARERSECQQQQQWSWPCPPIPSTCMPSRGSAVWVVVEGPWLRWRRSQLRRFLVRRCSVWLVGTALFFSGTVAVFVSYSFAPQSLLAPLGAAQFVSNVFFARVIHGARVTRRVVTATSVILLGIALVVSYSPQANDDFTVDVDTVKELYGYGAFQIYVTVLAVSAIGLHALYRCYRRKANSGQPLRYDETVRPLCYAMVSALVGTQSTLQAKCLSELLVSDRAAESLSDWFTYCVPLLGFIVGTVFWLYRMNRAVFWTFFATLNGGIYFREFFVQEFIKHDVAGFSMGVFIIFLGVFLLAPRNNSRAAEEKARVRYTNRSNGDAIGGNSQSHLRQRVGASSSDEVQKIHGGLAGTANPLLSTESTSTVENSEDGRRFSSSSNNVHRHQLQFSFDDEARSRALNAPEIDSRGITSDTTDEASYAIRGGRMMAELMAKAGALLLSDDVVFMPPDGEETGLGLGPSNISGSSSDTTYATTPGAIGQLVGLKDSSSKSGYSQWMKSGMEPDARPKLVSFVGDLPVLITHERTARAFETFIPRLESLRSVLDEDDEDDDDDDNNDNQEETGEQEHEDEKRREREG